MNTIKQKIADLFLTKKNSTITTLYTKTKPKLKSGNPYFNLLKISKVNCVINADYSKAMEKLGRVVDSRPWGKKLGHSLITHNGSSYLQIKPLKTDSIYMDGNKEIPSNEVKFYLSDFSAQVLPIRTYKLDNIIGFKHKGRLHIESGQENVIALIGKKAT